MMIVFRYEYTTGGSNKNGTSHHWVHLNVTWWILIVSTPYFGVGYNRDKINFLSNKIQIWNSQRSEFKFKYIVTIKNSNL